MTTQIYDNLEEIDILPGDAENAATQDIVIPAGLAGERMDKALAQQLQGLSRSRIQQLVRAGKAMIDGVSVTDPGYRLAEGRVVHLVIPPPEPALPEPQSMPLDILYEDDQLIVLNKPAGLVVHPAPGNYSGTLVNALLAHCGDSLSGVGGVRRPGIVHRLDKDTSGVMVVAKTDSAHQSLSAQFADHGRTGPLQRAYAALCWGVPLPRMGTIDAPLDRMVNNREKIAVVSRGRGREAITHYRVEDSFPRSTEPLVSLVRCELETGRTHQIRVHMAHKGHPLLGDPLYGSGFRSKEPQLGEKAYAALKALDRQALHAVLLGFAHPVTDEEMVFESPIPDDIKAVVEAIQGN